MNNLQIDVAFEFICPWCFIGKRNLEAALVALNEALPQLQVEVRWQGVQLLPGLPRTGVPFKEFYRQRLGSDDAVRVRQAQVNNAAGNAGLTLRLQNIPLMPNTSLVHRVFSKAQQLGAPVQVDEFLECLFQAYFIHGCDIGDAQTLLNLAENCGLDSRLSDVVTLADESFQSACAVEGVPNYTINQRVRLSGVRPPEQIYAALCRAIGQVTV